MQGLEKNDHVFEDVQSKRQPSGFRNASGNPSCYENLSPRLFPHPRWEKAGQVSREVWEKAGECGMLGILIPEEHGGIGGDLSSAAITWEEQ